jgi:hypothetical protein
MFLFFCSNFTGLMFAPAAKRRKHPTMQFVGGSEEQVDRFALLQTNSKQAGMEANDSANGYDAAFTKCKTLYHDEKKKHLYTFLTLINPISMLTDMNEYLSACKRQCAQKIVDSNTVGNSHIVSLQIMLKEEFKKPYVENERQAWERSLILLSEHLHAEFTNRRVPDNNIREMLFMFIIELMLNLESDVLEMFCVKNLLLWRLHICGVMTELVKMWLSQSNLELDESAPESSSMDHLYLYQFTKTTTIFWVLSPLSKLKKYAKLPGLMISAKTLANLHDSYSLRICYFCHKISTIRYFSKCQVCKTVYFCSSRCQAAAHVMHKSEFHCTSNMSDEHRITIMTLQKLVACLMSTAFTSYLENKYLSIDEESSVFRQFITEKKIKSCNWVATRGNDLGSISFIPVPDIFFSQRLNKNQLEQFNHLQDKLKMVKDDNFKMPIIIYANFGSEDNTCLRPVFSNLTLKQNSKLMVNELAHTDHIEYKTNARAFVSLEADADAFANLHEIEKLLSVNLTEQKF